MKIKMANIDKVLTLLTAKGVEKRKQSSMVAQILGIKYNSAKQKIDGKRSLTIMEMRKIYHYFNEPLAGIRDYNCVFIMNDMHVRCNVTVENECTEVINSRENYAVKHNDNYIIDVNRKEKIENMYRVKELDFLPAPTIAVLDNDADILELLKSLSKRFGIEAKTFQTKEEILEAMKKQTFDCFIIDWLLDYGKNSDEVISKIREFNET